MTAEPEYQALFLGAGAQMQCGVGQFTRLLYQAIEKLDPGRSTTLTLTRSEGSFADIWRAVGSAQSVVCNFPIVAWKRVICRPLLALAIVRQLPSTGPSVDRLTARPRLSGPEARFLFAVGHRRQPQFGSNQAAPIMKQTRGLRPFIPQKQPSRQSRPLTARQPLGYMANVGKLGTCAT